MKIVANYTGHLTDRHQRTELRLRIDNHRHASYLAELVEGIDYRIDIKPIKSKRSIEQNKLLWALLHALEIETKVIAMTWYIQALQDTGAVCEYIWATEKTEDSLKKQFRAIERIKPHKIKNSNGWLYKVFIGSSKFNTKEMTELIETVLRYCAELDIETELIE
jgi:hypothetical protein